MSDADAQEIKARLARIEALLLGDVAPVARPVAPLPSLLSVEQFADACGRGPLWVYRKIKSRQIAVTKAGKPYQIPAEQVAKFTKTKAAIL